MDYKELLKDPRWQKKKTEIFIRDNFTCQMCGSTTKTLHVHHKTYKRCHGEPWGCPDEDLITLCEDCHHAIHNLGYDYSFNCMIIKEHFPSFVESKRTLPCLEIDSFLLDHVNAQCEYEMIQYQNLCCYILYSMGWEKIEASNVYFRRSDYHHLVKNTYTEKVVFNKAKVKEIMPEIFRKDCHSDYGKVIDYFLERRGPFKFYNKPRSRIINMVKWADEWLSYFHYTYGYSDLTFPGYKEMPNFQYTYENQSIEMDKESKNLLDDLIREEESEILYYEQWERTLNDSKSDEDKKHTMPTLTFKTLGNSKSSLNNQ